MIGEGMAAGRASEAQAREEIHCVPQTAGQCAQDPERSILLAIENKAEGLPDGLLKGGKA